MQLENNHVTCKNPLIKQRKNKTELTGPTVNVESTKLGDIGLPHVEPLI
jgi:hypothetical protein